MTCSATMNVEMAEIVVPTTKGDVVVDHIVAAARYVVVFRKCVDDFLKQVFHFQAHCGNGQLETFNVLHSENGFQDLYAYIFANGVKK